VEERAKILLIEDNPSDAQLLNIYLKEAYKREFELKSVNNLTKGLELLGKETFTIIIIDLSLPDSFGLETFQAVYDKSPDTPIIVLTGHEDEQVGIKAMQLGAQDFLIKGKIQATELRKAINYSVERFKLLKALSENAKKLEERTVDLQREKQKLSEAQKLAHIGSWEWDILENKVSWSEELYHIHDISPQEHVSYELLLDFVHKADRENAKKVIEQSFHTHRPFNFYYRIVLANKTVRTLHARGEVIEDENHQAIKMLGTAQDVTERIYEEEMEKLAVAATKSYNSVIIADKNGTIEWVNDGFTKLTGYTLEEVKRTHGELLRKGAKTGLSNDTDFFELVIKNKSPVTYEGKNFTKDGKEYWVITTLTPVLDQSGEVERIIAIDSDITVRKQMEENLIRANEVAESALRKGNKALEELMSAKKELEESMRVKGQFLANMSHEIRTPMNAIVGFTDLIMKTPLSPDQKQYLEAIKTSGENLLVIINDILDFSKIQSGKVAFEHIDFKLSQVVSTLTELMLPKSVSKNIKLSTSIEKGIPENLIGDPTRLNQILLNLVGNAIKFTEKGEVKIRICLLSEDKDSVELEFSVIDTGIGIPDQKLGTIFEEFTQATNDTSRKYGGSGLGLTIVKQLVEMQGGTINVASKVGVGSMFSFILKYKKNLASSREQSTDQVEEQPSLMKKEVNILLVEDNILNQVLATKVLTDWNWNVEVAENGLIAIEKLEKKDFDIILMDIQLPEMDGYEATRFIRNKMPFPKCNTPIMALTAHAISSEEEKCYKEGMNGYVSKPFNQKVLYSKIVSILNERTNTVHTVIEKDEVKVNKQMKHTDLTYLKELSRGSNKFMVEMISLFISQTPEALSGLEKHFKNKDWKGLHAVAHKMKPSVSFVGLKEIEKEVKLVQDYAANETNLEELPPLIQKIKKVCEEAIRELQGELKQLAA
jgi:PAS domain S-box-containing protein